MSNNPYAPPPRTVHKLERALQATFELAVSYRDWTSSLEQRLERTLDMLEEAQIQLAEATATALKPSRTRKSTARKPADDDGVPF